MSYGKVEAPSSSPSLYLSTAKFAATSATLTVISLRSDRAPTSPTVNTPKHSKRPENPFCSQTTPLFYENSHSLILPLRSRAYDCSYYSRPIEPITARLRTAHVSRERR